jgi:hypothetical protein
VWKTVFGMPFFLPLSPSAVSWHLNGSQDWFLSVRPVVPHGYECEHTVDEDWKYNVVIFLKECIMFEVLKVISIKIRLLVYGAM